MADAQPYEACSVPMTDGELSIMDEALLAALGVVAGACVRELLLWLDHRERQRGHKRTRADDERTFGP